LNGENEKKKKGNVREGEFFRKCGDVLLFFFLIA
jgi:hypothetical protein